MKRNIKFLAVVALMVAALTSCDSDASRLFGDIPKIFLEHEAVMQQLLENGDASRIREENEQFDAKIEQAAEEISGKQIKGITSEYFKIISPLTMSFDGIYGDGEPWFTVSGNVEVEKDIVVEGPPSEYCCYVGLDGYNSEGKICFGWRSIGTVKGEYKDGKFTVKAGTPVKFDFDNEYVFRYISFQKPGAQDYLDAKELKLNASVCRVTRIDAYHRTETSMPILY